MALYLRGFCGNPVDNSVFDLWIKMWKSGQVFSQQRIRIPAIFGMSVLSEKNRAKKNLKKKFSNEKYAKSDSRIGEKS